MTGWLALMKYNDGDIMRFIQSLGWVMSEDTDPNSSDCSVNALADCLFRERLGFLPYMWEVARSVRQSSTGRSERIARTTQPEDYEGAGVLGR